MTDEEKARLAELKAKGELTEAEKAELAELNTKATGKTFTQEEVNGLITKKSREAVEKALKDLGVTDFETAKEGLAKLKELQDKDKTDLQKALDDIEALKTQITEKDSSLKSESIKNALLGAKVPEDQLARYTKLLGTYDNEDLSENVKALMEEFPLQVETPPPGPGFGGQSKGGGTQTADELQAEMDKIAGLA